MKKFYFILMLSITFSCDKSGQMEVTVVNHTGKLAEIESDEPDLDGKALSGDYERDITIDFEGMKGESFYLTTKDYGEGTGYFYDEDAIVYIDYEDGASYTWEVDQNFATKVDGDNNSTDNSSCEYLIGNTLDMISINGELPYTSVYIDEDNKSVITEGTFHFISSSEWESTMKYDETIDGNTTYDKLVEENGTYDCSYGDLEFFNTSNESTGTGSISNGTFTLHSGGYTHVFE